MSVTINYTSALTASVSGGTLTITGVTGGGNDSILIISASGTSMSSVTYAGQSMTKVEEAYYLLSPPSGTNNFVINSSDGLFNFAWGLLEGTSGIVAHSWQSGNTFPFNTFMNTQANLTTTKANSRVIAFGSGTFASPSGTPSFVAYTGTSLLANTRQPVFYSFTNLAFLDNGIVVTPTSVNTRVDFDIPSSMFYCSIFEIESGSQFKPQMTII